MLPTDTQSGSLSKSPGEYTLPGVPGKIAKLTEFGIQILSLVWSMTNMFKSKKKVVKPPKS